MTMSFLNLSKEDEEGLLNRPKDYIYIPWPNAIQVAKQLFQNISPSDGERLGLRTIFVRDGLLGTNQKPDELLRSDTDSRCLPNFLSKK